MTLRHAFGHAGSRTVDYLGCLGLDALVVALIKTSATPSEFRRALVNVVFGAFGFRLGLNVSPSLPPKT